MTDKLTPKQEAFVIAYLDTGNASEAYRRAYSPKSMSDENIWTEASKLLKHPKVAPRVAQIRAKVEERAIISKEWVISRLVDNVERAMQAQPVLDNEGKPTGEYRYDGGVANRALELIGKELRMFVDRKEVGKPGEYETMDADALRDHIRRETEALGLGRKSAEAAAGNRASGGKLN